MPQKTYASKTTLPLPDDSDRPFDETTIGNIILHSLDYSADFLVVEFDGVVVILEQKYVTIQPNLRGSFASRRDATFGRKRQWSPYFWHSVGMPRFRDRSHSYGMRENIYVEILPSVLSLRDANTCLAGA